MFWDSSALVPLLLPEARSELLTERLGADREVVIWWATPLECQSAIYRRHRESPLAGPVMQQMTDRLRAFVEHADTVAPTDAVAAGGPSRRRPCASRCRCAPAGRRVDLVRRAAA
jgi:uncharacterized protein with PIN domain